MTNLLKLAARAEREIKSPRKFIVDLTRALAEFDMSISFDRANIAAMKDQIRDKRSMIRQLKTMMKSMKPSRNYELWVRFSKKGQHG